MENKLNDKQVQDIFDFTAKKYVLYYDVQLELVDHICLRVEELMNQKEELSFEEALHKTYKSLGVFGFTKIQEEKSIQMNKYWGRKTLQYLTMYLKPPRLLMILLISLLLYNSLLVIQDLSEWLKVSIIVLISLMPILMILSHSWKWKNGHMADNKRLLIVESLFNHCVSLMALMQIGFQIVIQLGSYTLSPWLMALISLLVTLQYVLTYAVVHVFPVWLQDDLQKDYAHLIDIKDYVTGC